MVVGPVERERGGKRRKEIGWEIEKKVGNSGKKIGEPSSQPPLVKPQGDCKGLKEEMREMLDAMQGGWDLGRRGGEGQTGSDRSGVVKVRVKKNWDSSCREGLDEG